ncbi:Putative pterin-4-alpha-carbinolamine dehydratase [Cladobotryum mycophilum]|uniref:4a-hydroxytetrahydrobiopterin dehydratase n=1 Tax=Cladobotryum mycophilum TaxID=491253 RepID=A0ABR0T1W6_9HYPO
MSRRILTSKFKMSIPSHSPSSEPTLLLNSNNSKSNSNPATLLPRHKHIHNLTQARAPPRHIRWAVDPRGGRRGSGTELQDFMTAVSLQCKIKSHHPEWSNVYNTTFIRWTTHDPQGLSEQDVDLAIACDDLAKDFGELDPEPTNHTLKDLSEKAKIDSGDCCTLKK